MARVFRCTAARDHSVVVAILQAREALAEWLGGLLPGHLTRKKTSQLYSSKPPQMADASGEVLLYAKEGNS